MSHSTDIECRGVLLQETAKAYRVQKSEGHPAFWIPRSQIPYARKTRRDDGTIDIVFLCPEWLLDKNDAWDLVP